MKNVLINRCDHAACAWLNFSAHHCIWHTAAFGKQRKQTSAKAQLEKRRSHCKLVSLLSLASHCGAGYTQEAGVWCKPNTASPTKMTMSVQIYNQQKSLVGTQVLVSHAHNRHHYLTMCSALLPLPLVAASKLHACWRSSCAWPTAGTLAYNLALIVSTHIRG